MMTTEYDIKKAIVLDCLQLIEKFSKKNNPEFQIFCVEWKSIHFHHIYTGQLSEIDMVHTTIEAFKFCISILKKENCKMKKIGSIYLLYSLYYKQPSSLYVKIKVNLKTWQMIKQFIDSLENDCIQVKYIFWKLVSENAFRFVESEIYYGLEPFFNKEQDYTNKTLSSVVEENILKDDIINLTHKNEGFIEGFALLEKNYNNIKNVINESNKNETNYVPIESTNFLDDIKKDILSINEIFNTNNNSKGEENIEMNKNIQDRRKAIRKKAFSKNNKDPGTSKNVNQNEISDEDSDVEEFVDDINTDRGRRTSKLDKIKTLLSDPLPDEIKKELGDEKA